MSKHDLTIAMIFDVPTAELTFADPQALVESNADYRDERDVYRALKRLGHTVALCPVHNDLDHLVKQLDTVKPDIAFCMFESFNNSRDLAPNLVGMLEMLGVPYTGASAGALNICKDKALTKKILGYHGIKVPKFVTAPRRKRCDLSSMVYPAIVKPLGLDASEGITQKSIVYDEAQARRRIATIHKQYVCDAIVEEYIEGRELYVGVLGTPEPMALPPQEMHFSKLAKNHARIATYSAKWDETYRSRYGIDSGKPEHLSLQQRRAIHQFGKDVFTALGLNGYARIDLRMDLKGDLYFLEANPNPAIKRGDDFPECARSAGWSYQKLIAKILDLAAA